MRNPLSFCSKSVNRIAGALIFICIIAGALVLSAEMGNAQPDCIITIVKEATSDDGTEFFFNQDLSGAVTEFSLFSGESEDIGIVRTDTLQVTETVPEGWLLADVECVFEGEGVVVGDIENGISVGCVAPQGLAQCTFINVPIDNIPTFSEWGMIGTAIGLMAIGVFFAVRRRRMVSQ